MIQLLSVLVVAVALTGCESEQTEPRPPPESPESERDEPLKGLEELEETAYESVGPERSGEMLESARAEPAEAAESGATAEAGPGADLTFESIPHSGLRGRLGDYEDAAILFIDDGSDGPNAVEVVVLRRSAGHWIVETERPLGGPWRVREVEDLFVADAHDDGDIDIFVVGRFSTGAGSAADKQFSATIPFVWREGRFRYPNRLDDSLTDAASAERALEILRLDDVIDR